MKLSKNNFYFGVILLLAVVFNYVMANPLEKISPSDAYKMQTEKTSIIVDVRELNEQKEGRIKDALSLPMSIMDNDKTAFEKIIAGYPKDKNIIVYCHSGRRAGLVGSELEKKGFKVLNLGGFEAWKTSNLPIE
jgi:rhodanese-related sulfurtransferase